MWIGGVMYRGYIKVWHKLEDSSTWSRGLEYIGLLVALVKKANTV